MKNSSLLVLIHRLLTQRFGRGILYLCLKSIRVSSYKNHPGGREKAGIHVAAGRIPGICPHHGGPA